MAEGTKFVSNGAGHMTNMVAIPVESKNLYIFSSLEPVDR